MSNFYLKDNEIKEKFLSRPDLTDASFRSAIDRKITNQDSIVFLPNQITDRNEFVNGELVYSVHFYGVLPCGNKVLVVARSVNVYFLIKVKNNQTPENFLPVVREMLIENNINYTKTEVIYGYPLAYFQEHKSAYIKVSFKDTRSYTNACNLFTDNGYETASDDDAYTYFNKVAREYKINTASWNKIEQKKYTASSLLDGNFKPGNSHLNNNCRHVIYTSIDAISPLDDKKIQENDFLSKDKTLVATWDIETYSHSNQNGEIPTPETTNWDIFMICATFHWYHSMDTLVSVCIVDCPCAVDDKIFYDEAALKKSNDIKKFKEKASKYNYIIECSNEKNLCQVFYEVLAKMAPDIICAFNGGAFDWPNYREKLRRYNLLMDFRNKVSGLSPTYNGSNAKYADAETNILSKYYKNERVKISPEEQANLICLKMPGIIDIDVMIIFKQMYSKAEVGKKYSLNFYLKINKLGLKEDLPYKEMFRMYEHALKWKSQPEGPEKDAMLEKVKADFAKMATYCRVDAYRCQQLLVKRSILQEKRELANMSYVGVYDSFYRANGMKVRQLVGSYACSWHIYFTMKKTDRTRIKFSGARVFYPEKGLNTEYPIVGLDFNSLYPSLMMAYNLSPEKTIVNEGPETEYKIEQLKQKGYEIHDICFEGFVNDKSSPENGKLYKYSGWSIRHSNNIYDQSEDFIENENLNENSIQNETPKKQVKARKSKNNYYQREALPCENMGIFPYVLKILFEKRKIVKAQFVELDKLIEKLEILKEENKEFHRDNLIGIDFVKTGYSIEKIESAKTIEEKEKLLDDMQFICNNLNNKQKAMKVHMNTFYGEQGNPLSQIYKLLVAGGITSSGKYNISLVADFLESRNYNLWYGDTDSTYISSPTHLFADFKDNYIMYLSMLQIKDEFKHKINYNDGKNPEIEYKPVLYDEIENEIKQKIKDISKPIQEEYKEIYNQTVIKSKKEKWDISEKFEESIKPHYFELNRRLFNLYEEFLTQIQKDEFEKDKIEKYKKCMHFVLKEEYWTQLVQITRRDVSRLRIDVNNYLAEDNGTKFLTMAYEEVLSPCCFTGKKKYFGIAHLENENFHIKPEKIFIRGIDIIKQGQFELSREVGYKIMSEAVSVYNEKDLMTIVLEQIKRIHERNWTNEDYGYFVQSAKFKPNKKNVAVQSFVKRMKEMHKKYVGKDPNNPIDPVKAALYAPPEPGDSFRYIIVNKHQTHDWQGKKLKLTKGDQMEYESVFLESQKNPNKLLRMELDIQYYIEKYIVGVCARFIAYRDEFYVPSLLNEGDYDDEKSVKQAKKFLLDYSAKCAGADSEDMRKKGVFFRKVRKKVEETIYGKINPNTRLIQELELQTHSYDETKPLMWNKIQDQKTKKENVTRIVNFIETKLTADHVGYGKRFLARYAKEITQDPKFIYTLTRHFNLDARGAVTSQNQSCVKMYQDRIAEHMNQLEALLPDLHDISNSYNMGLENIIVQMRSENTTRDIEQIDQDQIMGNFDQIMPQEYEKIVKQFKSHIEAISANIYLRNCRMDIITEMKKFIAERLKVKFNPTIDAKKETKNSNYQVLDLKMDF